ncbi:ABC transporter ATP-binding protein [Fusobacterium sp. MFO224]|uniref:ABC transporter ATP-binding protein n=1 Tax=Fusobacterium sp. MFO224 TaxID=3378070 RepID=UPI003854AE92
MEHTLDKKEILSYENISFVRENRKILNNINWKINSGEHWALIGLNGSGKSTLLNMIPAYSFPSKGKLIVFENIFGNCVWAKVRKKLGFVSASLSNFSNILNIQNIEDIIISGKFSSIGIYEKVTENDKQLAKKLIEEFGISYLIDKNYKEFSQGEKMKVLLARSFMNEPKLLILDEPCAGLDLKSREHFLKLLRKTILKSKAPLIYVTHQLDELIPEITHVAILGKNGNMIATGKKEEVLTENNLSALYEVDVKLIWEQGRPWVIIK